MDKSIAFQIRSLRDSEGWTQGEFAEKLGIKHQNNVSARLENPYYGRHSLTTLKKIAATCDVALVVWFVPFSRLLYWVTGTPYTDKGLSDSFYKIPTFDREFTATAIHVESQALESPVPMFRNSAASQEDADINSGGTERKPMGKAQAEMAVAGNGGR